jgi:4'-phosphopantetheinyl transferase EntD
MSVLRGAGGALVVARYKPDALDRELDRGAALVGEERALAGRLGPRRARDFVAGRRALREAALELGAPLDGPILRTPRGAPQMPPGWVGSVSHKSDASGVLAAAWVERVAPASTPVGLGVDLEVLGEPRVKLARSVLTPTERALVDAASPSRRGFETLARFSLKEALYKALDPRIGRGLDFLDVALVELTAGRATARFERALAAVPLETELWWWLDGPVLVAAARASPARVAAHTSASSTT